MDVEPKTWTFWNLLVEPNMSVPNLLGFGPKFFSQKILRVFSKENFFCPKSNKLGINGFGSKSRFEKVQVFGSTSAGSGDIGRIVEKVDYSVSLVYT